MGRNASNKTLRKPKFVARITLKVSKWLALYSVRMSRKGIQIGTEPIAFRDSKRATNRLTTLDQVAELYEDPLGIPDLIEHRNCAIAYPPHTGKPVINGNRTSNARAG